MTSLRALVWGLGFPFPGEHSEILSQFFNVKKNRHRPFALRISLLNTWNPELVWNQKAAMFNLTRRQDLVPQNHNSPCLVVQIFSTLTAISLRAIVLDSRNSTLGENSIGLGGRRERAGAEDPNLTRHPLCEYKTPAIVYSIGRDFRACKLIGLFNHYLGHILSCTT